MLLDQPTTSAQPPWHSYRLWSFLACITALCVFGFSTLVIIAIAIINYHTELKYPNILSPNRQYIYYGLGEWLLYTGVFLTGILFMLIAIRHLRYRHLLRHYQAEPHPQNLQVFINQQVANWRFTARAIAAGVALLCVFSVLGWYYGALQTEAPAANTMRVSEDIFPPDETESRDLDE